MMYMQNKFKKKYTHLRILVKVLTDLKTVLRGTVPLGVMIKEVGHRVDPHLKSLVAIVAKSVQQ